MFNLLKEVSVLRAEGKLHKRLITRVRMLVGVSLVLTVVVLFNVTYRGASWPIAAGLFVAGLVAGAYLFSRMNAVQWNEELEIVEAGRMDALGYGVLALYVVFEIGLRTFLKDAYPLSATTFILAAVGGTLLGRAAGMLVEIHRVFTQTRGEA